MAPSANDYKIHHGITETSACTTTIISYSACLTNLIMGSHGPHGSPWAPRGSPSRVARMINTWLARHNAFHAQTAKPQRNYNVKHTKTLLLLREIWEGIFKIRQYMGSHGSHVGPHGSPCMGPMCPHHYPPVNIRFPPRGASCQQHPPMLIGLSLSINADSGTEYRLQRKR